MDFIRENERLKDQLRKYLSAVEMGIAFKSGNEHEDEINSYERKLVQVSLTLQCTTWCYSLFKYMVHAIIKWSIYTTEKSSISSLFK